MLLRGMPCGLLRVCEGQVHCLAQWCHRHHPRQYLHLRHGNHLRIAVPPPESDIARVPTRCVARMFQMDIAPEDVEAYYYIMNDIGIIPL